MHWIALHPRDDTPEGRQLLAWRMLGYTPRVALVEEAVLMEVQSCLRLWGGLERLLARISEQKSAPAPARQAQGASSLIALARLRLPPAQNPDTPPHALPLATLSAARPHLPVLARLGCRTWGDLRALPRAGVARRLGADLLAALDQAEGRAPDIHAWEQLPERFDEALELPVLATTTAELDPALEHLLLRLQVWLTARVLGASAIALHWRFDQRRLNGAELPPGAALDIRTAQPVQGMAHLRRLIDEHLARTPLAAPVNRLGLRTLQLAPWQGQAAGLLPGEQGRGEALHELVERLSARLGPTQVLMAQPHADHRPERMQRWLPAQQVLAQAQRAAPPCTALPLAPTWLLATPQPLTTQDERPQWQGRALARLTPAQRIETGWWEEAHAPPRRDYFIAQAPGQGLVWIYREQNPGDATPRWYLHGLYA